MSHEPGSPNLPPYQLDPSSSGATPIRSVSSYESISSDLPTSEMMTNGEDEESEPPTQREEEFEGPHIPHHLLSSSAHHEPSPVFYQPSYESIGTDLDDEFRAFHSQDITTQDIRDFILGLQRSLHVAGSSTHRTEILTSQVAHVCHSCSPTPKFFTQSLTHFLSVHPHCLVIVSFSTQKSLNVDVTIACFTGLLMTTFNSPPVQSIHLLVDQSLDYAKLQDLCTLASGVATKEIPTIDAMKRLLAIQTEPPLYPPIMQIAAYAVIGCFCPLLFWGGTWITSALGLFLSVIVGMMVIYLGRVGRFKRILEFSCALVSSFIAFGVSTFAPSFCPFATSLASIVWLLPGLSLTTAVTEMAARSAISGSSRFFMAVLSAFQLGFGLAVGQKLVFWAPSDDSEIIAGCPLAVPTYLLPFCLVAVNGAFAILLNCRKSQMIPASISGVVTFLVFKLLTLYFGFNGDLTTGIAAFFTGITGQLISRVSDNPPLVTVLCGIMLLVPGALSVRGVTTLFVGESASGVSFGLDTTLSCFAITMGLLLSKSMFPLRSKSRFYATGIHRTSTKDTGESLVALV